MEDPTKIKNLQKQLFAGISVESSLIKEVAENLSWDDQKSLFEVLFLDPLSLKYPVKLPTQISVLKTLIEFIEIQTGEVLDELYQQLCLLKAKPNDEDRIFKHFFLPDDSRVVIKEATCMIGNGTTGLHTWEAAFRLVEFCLDRREKFRGKKLLELGSGTGFAGIAVHRLVQPSRIIVTDCHPKVLSILAENLDINCCPRSEIDVMELWWGEPFQLDFVPDYLLASDIVYDDSLFMPLLQTISAVFELNEKCTFFLLATVRNKKTITRFVRAVKKKFRVEQVDEATSGTLAFLDKPDTRVKIFGITKFQA